MDPTKRFHDLLQRFEVFCRDVIDPAVYPESAALEIGAWQCQDPAPFAHAAKQAFQPVSVGWDWGPRWSTCWFRIRGRVPASMADRTVALRFSTDTEALLWKPTPDSPSKGTPVHGLDVNRDAVRIFEPARGGEPVDLYVEAACNHLFGDRGLQWDPPEIHRRWSSATPGRLDRCELAVINETVWRLKWVYTFALQLARQLPEDSARARELFGALRRCTNSIPDDAVAETAPGALAELEAVVRSTAGGSATLCHAVGHAHIDTAWLWPIRETRRKCLRTFATALRNMERFPDYRFLCSQAQQYAWLEETSPGLFAQVSRRVAEGRWEPGGAMWVEPDCTAPSGESLIRQVIHADRYWRGKFGDERGRQRFLYLPDTFGFPAQLPQIMRLAGLDTFITNKLHWNDTNTFPYTTFIWRGLDGSEVLAHNTPGMDYNATMTPRELIRGERTHKNKDLPPPVPARWLQPFGFGDGGGGPTEWNILNAELAADSDSLPRVRFSTVNEFCDALHRDVAAARERDPSSVPVHDGELYLELHRGTYTTHARIKQVNAECEELLRQAEILTFAGPTRLPRHEEQRVQAELDRAWKLLLLNQFHDILPGSSIGWVYQDAERDYAAIRATAQPIIDAGRERWARAVSMVHGSGAEVRLSGARPGPSVHAIRHPMQRGPVAVIDEHSLTVQHGDLALRFDRAGRIVSLRITADGRERCSKEPMNQLVLYEDRPRLWEAWDFDREHDQKPAFVTADATRIEVHREAAEPPAIRFTHAVGRGSRLVQTFRFRPHHPRSIDVETEVDWQESHRLLRVLFPTRLRPTTFRAGTQFGWIERPAHRAARAGGAMFECPFQGWISIGRHDDDGLTIGCIDRFGASCEGGTLGLSLLRSTRYPDDQADVGDHRVRYVISFRSSHEPPNELEELRSPPAVVRASPAPGQPEPTADQWAPIATRLRLESVTLSDDGQRLHVRCSNPVAAEDDGLVSWGLPVGSVEPIDFLGRPMSLEGFVHSAPPGEPATTRFRVRPFQIVTLAVTRAD